MCSSPVTFGGGSAITKVSPAPCGSASKSPVASSHSANRRGSTVAGSNRVRCLSSSWVAITRILLTAVGPRRYRWPVGRAVHRSGSATPRSRRRWRSPTTGCPPTGSTTREEAGGRGRRSSAATRPRWLPSRRCPCRAAGARRWSRSRCVPASRCRGWSTRSGSTPGRATHRRWPASPSRCWLPTCGQPPRLPPAPSWLAGGALLVLATPWLLAEVGVQTRGDGGAVARGARGRPRPPRPPRGARRRAARARRTGAGTGAAGPASRRLPRADDQLRSRRRRAGRVERAARQTRAGGRAGCRPCTGRPPTAAGRRSQPARLATYRIFTRMKPGT